MLGLLFIPSLVYAAEEEFTPCAMNAKMLRSFGILILVAKVAVPLIIIVSAVIHFGSVVMSGKEEDMQKAIKKTGLSIAAGIIVFVLPSLVNVIFLATTNFNPSDDSKICSSCLLHPGSDLCLKYASKD